MLVIVYGTKYESFSLTYLYSYTQKEINVDKEFKSFLKVPGGGEIHRCYYPFKLDTYGRGCMNDCLYCYSRSTLHFRNLWDAKTPAVADIKKIEKMLDDVLVKDKKIKYYEHFKNRVPLRLGGMTDVFQDTEKTERVTYQLLKLLKEYQYPYLILTKNKLVAEYMDVLDPNLAYVQFTITTPYDDISKLYEPEASTTTERLQAAKDLTGFYTAARVNPLFPKYPDGHYTRKDSFIDGGEDEMFRYFDWHLVDMFKEANINTVIAGFVRLSHWNIKWIEEDTGKNLKWLFDSDTKAKNTALHFSTEEKRYYYERMKKRCDEVGMDFTVCYDGDEDYETFRYLWANPDDCCNGKFNIKEFKNAFDFENEHFLNKKDI